MIGGSAIRLDQRLRGLVLRIDVLTERIRRSLIQRVFRDAAVELTRFSGTVRVAITDISVSITVLTRTVQRALFIFTRNITFFFRELNAEAGRLREELLSLGGVESVTTRVVVSVRALFRSIVDGARSVTIIQNFVVALANTIQLVGLRLNQALESVEGFTTGAVNFFRMAYEQIVGGSFWVDTVDGVIENAGRLTTEGLTRVRDFTSRVTSLFRDVFRGVTSARSLPDFNIVATIERIDAQSAIAGFAAQISAVIQTAFGRSTAAIFEGLNSTLPVVFALLTRRLSFILSAVAFSFGTELLAAANSLVRQLGIGVDSLGAAIGRAAGAFVTSIIAELPRLALALLSTLGDAGNAFIRQILSGIPLIGDGLAGLFNILDSLTGNLVGTAVAGGIVYTLFFGRLTPAAIGARALSVFGVVRAGVTRLSAISLAGGPILDQILGTGIQRRIGSVLAAVRTSIFAFSRSIEAGVPAVLNHVLFATGNIRSFLRNTIATVTALFSAVRARATSLFSGLGTTLGSGFARGGLLRTLLFGAAGATALLASTSAFASGVDGATTGSSWFGSLSPYIESGGFLLAALVGTGGITAIVSGITAIGSSLGALVAANPIIAATAAVAAVGGFLAVNIFGRGDTFNERLSNATLRLTSFFGIVDAFVGRYERRGVLERILGDIDATQIGTALTDIDRAAGRDRLELDEEGLRALNVEDLTGGAFGDIATMLDRIARIQEDIRGETTGIFGSSDAISNLTDEQNALVRNTNRLIEQQNQQQLDQFRTETLGEQAAGGLGEGRTNFTQALIDTIPFFEGYLNEQRALLGELQNPRIAQQIRDASTELQEFTQQDPQAISDERVRFLDNLRNEVDAAIAAVRDATEEASEFFFTQAGRDQADALLAAARENADRTAALYGDALEEAARQAQIRIDFGNITDAITDAFSIAGVNLSRMDLLSLPEDQVLRLGALSQTLLTASETFADARTFREAQAAAMALAAASEALQSATGGTFQNLNRRLGDTGAGAVSPEAFSRLTEGNLININRLLQRRQEAEERILALGGMNTREEQIQLRILEDTDRQIRETLSQAASAQSILREAGLGSETLASLETADLNEILTLTEERVRLEERLARIGRGNVDAYRDVAGQIGIINEQIENVVVGADAAGRLQAPSAFPTANIALPTARPDLSELTLPNIETATQALNSVGVSLTNLEIASRFSTEQLRQITVSYDNLTMAEDRLNSGLSLSIEERERLVNIIERETDALRGFSSVLEAEFRGFTASLSANLSRAIAGGDFGSLGEVFTNTLSNSLQESLQSNLQSNLDTIFGALSDSIFSSLSGAVSGGGGAGGGIDFGSIFTSVGSFLGFQRGGEVAGPGTSTSDSILARLSDGEFVVRSAVVERLGVDFFERLNAGMLPAFQGGGFAGAQIPESPSTRFRALPGLQMGGVVEDIDTNSSATFSNRPPNITNINISGNVDQRAIDQIRDVIAGSPTEVGAANMMFSTSSQGLRSR